MASRLLQLFLHVSPMCATDRHTDKQTMARMTSVAIRLVQLFLHSSPLCPQDLHTYRPCYLWQL